MSRTAVKVRLTFTIPVALAFSDGHNDAERSVAHLAKPAAKCANDDPSERRHATRTGATCTVTRDGLDRVLSPVSTRPL